MHLDLVQDVQHFKSVCFFGFTVQPPLDYSRGVCVCVGGGGLIPMKPPLDLLVSKPDCLES